MFVFANSAMINVDVQECLRYADSESFRYIPRHGIAGLYSSYIFNLLRNFHSSILIFIVTGPVGIFTNSL